MMQELTELAKFTRVLEQQNSTSFVTYADLHQWCCEHPGVFWSALLCYSKIPFYGNLNPALTGTDFIDREFFPNITLNYARCLLDDSLDTSTGDLAVTVVAETGQVESVSRAELRTLTLSVASTLRDKGVVSGDRVVAIARNSIESIVACLACAALGATWSSVSPELGATAIVERFGQLQPKVLFTNTEYTLNGVVNNIEDTLSEFLAGVSSIEQVVMLASRDPLVEPDQLLSSDANVLRWEEMLGDTCLTLEELDEYPFNHPLFVLFSSGTTGVPKCIVHGAGGTLLEHLKEHRLHGDLGAKDTLLFQTSTGWMMWNWQLSALASGTHIVLYDGSVSCPEKSNLLKVISDHGVTVFGTSPAYIQFLIESGVVPVSLHEFPQLRVIQSTGSVLSEAHFSWIVESFKKVPVQSVSGGTDMIGCLVLGHPELPVHTGDSQCISLGIDVRVKPDDANLTKLAHVGTGELVIVKPFPSQPVFLWNDPESVKLKSSYFDKNPGVWTHGDQIRISESGSPRILGRSDGTLNIRGVRIGPSEILTVVNQIDGVHESMAIEQVSPREPGGSRLVLLLVMHSDEPLERPFVLQLKKRLALEASRLHVPAVVAKVPALPRTHNGKLSEKAARDAINRHEVVNFAALSNPEVLAEIQQQVPEAPL